MLHNFGAVMSAIDIKSIPLLVVFSILLHVATALWFTFRLWSSSYLGKGQKWTNMLLLWGLPGLWTLVVYYITKQPSYTTMTKKQRKMVSNKMGPDGETVGGTMYIGGGSDGISGM